MTDYLPARPDQWLWLLASGWRFHDDFAPEFTDWNSGWPVVVMIRDAMGDSACG